MAPLVTHSFVTAKTDGTDTSLLRPSNWNAAHVITMDTNTLMGKASAGTGPAEAIPVSTATIALLAAADIPSILAYLGISPPTTGDAKLTLKSTADTGWLMFDDGTFGGPGSGASNRANLDTLNLFNLLYAAPFTDTTTPILTSAGAAVTRASLGSAAAAWASLCRMSLPKTLGRALAIAGAGSGLTARTLGTLVGQETVTLATTNLPPYTPSGSVTVFSPTVNIMIGGAGGAGPGFNNSPAAAALSQMPASSATFSGNAQGGTSTPFPTMQPSSFLNAMVKL